MQEQLPALPHRVIHHDQPLQELFRQFDDQPVQGASSHHPTVLELPSPIDPHELERGYHSEHQPKNRPIRKNSRARVGAGMKNSRAARKEKKSKLYIEMLQNKVFELQEEVEELRRRVEHEEGRGEGSGEAERMIGGFYMYRKRHFEMLMGLVRQEGRVDEKALLREYDMLRIRQGAMGKDRIKVINYYFTQLCEIILPDTQKYMLKTVEADDMFQAQETRSAPLSLHLQQWRREMPPLVFEGEKRAKMAAIKLQIKQQKAEMEGYFLEFYQLKRKIVEASRRVETIYDGMVPVLSPVELALGLCLIDKYRLSVGFNIHDIFPGPFRLMREEEKDGYDPSNLLPQFPHSDKPTQK